MILVMRALDLSPYPEISSSWNANVLMPGTVTMIVSYKCAVLEFLLNRLCVKSKVRIGVSPLCYDVGQ